MCTLTLRPLNSPPEIVAGLGKDLLKYQFKYFFRWILLLQPDHTISPAHNIITESFPPVITGGQQQEQQQRMGKRMLHYYFCSIAIHRLNGFIPPKRFDPQVRCPFPSPQSVPVQESYLNE